MNEIKVRFVNLGLEYKELKEEIINKIDELSSQGAYVNTLEVEEFEKNIAKFCETDYVIAVGNCTDALFLVMEALGIGQGDEVITAPNSFIASVGSIVAAGAKPVFVDVKEDYNIDTSKIEDVITQKTKAIMPIHLTGRPVEIDPLFEIARKYKLYVIEDAAQAIGAKYKDKRVGSFGIVGCFSLHPLKNLHVQGDGGFISTNNKELYEKLKKLHNHGLKNRDECEFFGYNSRLDGIQAGIANIKLKHIEEWNKRHREIASIYRGFLKDVVQVPVDKEYEEPVYHNFVIMTEKRNELQKFLLENGIETKIHYPIPIHLQEASKYFGYKEGDFPVVESQAKKILSLPIYPGLKEWQIEYVINKIKTFFE